MLAVFGAHGRCSDGAAHDMHRTYTTEWRALLGQDVHSRGDAIGPSDPSCN